MGKVKMAGVMIFIALLLLMFFSNTIYNYNIPEVQAAIPQNGRLNKRETASGAAEWAQTAEMYFELGGKIEELFVEEGGRVAEGDLMARMSFDTEEAERRLVQLDIERDRLEVAAGAAGLRIERLQAQIESLRAEVFSAEGVSGYPIAQLEASISKARGEVAKAGAALAQAEELFLIGAISGQERGDAKSALDGAAYELDALLLEYEDAKATKAEEEERNAQALADKEKSRGEQIDEWEYEIEAARRDITSNSLDMRRNSAERDVCLSQLQDYSDSLEIRAEQAGEIISLAASRGQSVDAGQLFASLGLGDTFDIVCRLSLENNFVAAGDECTVSNTGHSFTAVVTKLSPKDLAKEATVRVSSGEITPGETFEAEFSKESAKSTVLVPNGAVNMDSNGHYVYYIRKREGILGEEYYAEKSSIYIGDSDSDSTAVAKGMTFLEPIVLLSDKPLSNGDTVKVRNEGDFFVD